MVSYSRSIRKLQARLESASTKHGQTWADALALASKHREVRHQARNVRWEGKIIVIEIFES